MTQIENLAGGVSVVIPARNSEDCIAECIESALDQGTFVREVIVADQNSTDETVSVALSFGDPRVKIVCLPRCSLEEATKAAAREAKCDWLYVLKSLDPIPRNTLSRASGSPLLIPRRNSSRA